MASVKSLKYFKQIACGLENATFARTLSASPKDYGFEGRVAVLGLGNSVDHEAENVVIGSTKNLYYPSSQWEAARDFAQKSQATKVVLGEFCPKTGADILAKMGNVKVLSLPDATPSYLISLLGLLSKAGKSYECVDFTQPWSLLNELEQESQDFEAAQFAKAVKSVTQKVTCADGQMPFELAEALGKEGVTIETKSDNMAIADIKFAWDMIDRVKLWGPTNPFYLTAILGVGGITAYQMARMSAIIPYTLF